MLILTESKVQILLWSTRKAYFPIGDPIGDPIGSSIRNPIKSAIRGSIGDLTGSPIKGLMGGGQPGALLSDNFSPYRLNITAALRG